MRLIDAKRLYEKTAEWEAQALAQVERYIADEENISEWKRWTAILNERTAFKHDVADAPTVDAVEVVRCKDCVYRDTDPTGAMTDGFCRWNPDERPDDDDYCSYGERRTE